jgi:peptidoglycan hydrolase-like protein with peptidoglycan-binding domain
MNSFQRILKSFNLQDNLNPKIWSDNNGDIKMLPKVRETLLDISNEFIEYLNIDIIVSDIIMTGSLSNYNWSEFSDVDLHIVADFNQFPEDIIPLYEELFKLKKTLFNENHNIKVYGYDVELYVQNEEESHFSSGVYSVLHNEWITKPKKENVKIDINLIKNKTKQWMDTIDSLVENIESTTLDEAKKIIERYKEKLKKYRSSGLEKKGEYSDENLVFKVLRRNGYLEKLFNLENQYIDKELSLKEVKLKHMNEQDKSSNIDDKLENKIESSKKSNFLKKLKKIAQSNKSYKNLKEKGKRIPYQSDVEIIQTSLQFLGYSLPKFGVDGLFGPETEKSTKEFQKDYDLQQDGILDTIDLQTLYAVLVVKDFSDEDLSKIQKEKEFDFTGDINKQKSIMDFLINKGLTKEQSAGIIGNLTAESNLNPLAFGDNGTSFGIAQWHLDRKDKLIEYCNSNGKDYKSLSCQMDYLWYELNTDYKKVLQKIKNADDAEESATIFAREYEKPYSKDYSKRVSYAMNTLDQYYSNFA